MSGIANINPRHIIRVSYTEKNRHGAEQARVHLTDGTSETVVGNYDEVSETFAPVIAAYPGFEYICAIDNEAGKYVEVMREPIIGWRCIANWNPPPITASGAERLANPGAILNPKGRLIVRDGDDYNRIEDWLNALNDDRESA